MSILKTQLTNSIGQIKEYVDAHNSELGQTQAQIVPSIDANTKHWFIANVDTGVSAGGTVVTDEEISKEINEILYGIAGGN